MRFVLTYNDINLWFRNFLDLDVHVCPYNTQSGEFTITSPAVGIRKLLPSDSLSHRQYFTIDEVAETALTIGILGINKSEELRNNILAKYINYCSAEDIMTLLSRGRFIIHFDKMPITHRIKLQLFQLAENGVDINFNDNPNIHEQLHMIQTLLRAGYTKVRMIPEDMPYTGYWFSDDMLDYTLIMAEHPADIRLCSSVHVMEWLEIGNSINSDDFHSVYPTTQIDYQYGDVSVTIPVTIAELEINARTIGRNCKRMQEEIKNVITDIIYNLNN